MQVSSKQTCGLEETAPNDTGNPTRQGTPNQKRFQKPLLYSPFEKVKTSVFSDLMNHAEETKSTRKFDR